MMIFISKGRYNDCCILTDTHITHCPSGAFVIKAELRKALANGKSHIRATSRYGEWMRFRGFGIDNGHLRIGCCWFSKAVTKRILRWAGSETR